MSGGSSYNTSNKLVFSGLGAGAGASGSSASLRSVQSPSLESHSISINKDLLVTAEVTVETAIVPIARCPL